MKFNSQWTNIEGWKKINGKQEKLKVLKKKRTLTNNKIDFFFVNLASTWCQNFFWDRDNSIENKFKQIMNPNS